MPKIFYNFRKRRWELITQIQILNLLLKLMLTKRKKGRFVLIIPL